MTGSVPALLRHTRAEALDIDQASPADELMDAPCDRWVRCIDIAAQPDLVYRWLCQLTIAPYSIDLLDNLGRRSPPVLVPGAEDLRIGQPFLIFAVADFSPGSFLAGRSRPRFRRVYGTLTVSYQVLARAEGGTRLRANACISHQSGLARRTALALGDTLMAGRQLRNLKALAERRW